MKEDLSRLNAPLVSNITLYEAIRFESLGVRGMASRYLMFCSVSVLNVMFYVRKKVFKSTQVWASHAPGTVLTNRTGCIFNVGVFHQNASLFYSNRSLGHRSLPLPARERKGATYTRGNFNLQGSRKTSLHLSSRPPQEEWRLNAAYSSTN